VRSCEIANGTTLVADLIFDRLRRLYFPDKKEIQSVFDGRNAAALAIVNREKERAKLKGITYEAEIDGVLTPFGVNEETIFRSLGSDNWKESRWERLLVRELPE
jgi:hypothetical protein